MSQDRAQRPDPNPSTNDGGSAAPGAANGASPSAGHAGTYFLGRYRVVDEIGIGGMASVHLARMDGPGGFQKWVAIKRIHSHLIEDDSFVHMFLDEARIAARISHPNVATVFELGKHDDTYWIAMEYLHGEPLREVMRRTEEMGAPMPPEIACRVIADAAEGLHAAHELLGKNGEKLNLIHRDVTPHNLFVTYDGATKVVDFGIAKFSSRMSSTRAGTLKGKLAYMSPEQVQGETIDRRTDIFALGVVLWELTTGQRLFRMDSDLDTLAKVQECVIPSPSSIVRGYPIDLERIVMKALSKNRGERFKTAREFSRQLQSLLMKRGLFIASDEVATYVKAIFKDRIERREAHLRWAGEVTQTINVEALGASQGITNSAIAGGSDLSFHSDIQTTGSGGGSGAGAVTARPAPRPAAGVPASASSGALGVPPRSDPQPFLPAPSMARPPVFVERTPRAPLAPATPPPAPLSGFDLDDAPTLLASGGAPLPNLGAYEDGDDAEDTVVSLAPTLEDSTEVPARAPLPAAGRPPPAEPPSLSQPRTLAGFPASPEGVRPRGADAYLDAYPDSPESSGGPRTLPLPTALQYAASSGSSGSQSPALQISRGAPPKVSAMEGIEDPSLPTAAATGEAAPPIRLLAPTLTRLAARANPDQTTQLRSHRTTPVWAVAILAGTALLAVVGFVFLLVSLASRMRGTSAESHAETSPTTPSKPAATTQSAAAPGAPPATPSPSSPTAANSSAWPFQAARNGFLSAVANPSSASPPAPATPEAKAADGRAETAPVPAQDNDPAATPSPSPPAPSLPAAQTASPSNASAGSGGPSPAGGSVGGQPVPIPMGQPPQGSSSKRATNEGAALGQLSIICIPGCDQVYDNGKPLGPSPVFKRPTVAGSHKIRLVSSNPHVEKVVSTIVVADSVAIVRESMQ